MKTSKTVKNENFENCYAKTIKKSKLRRLLKMKTSKTVKNENFEGR